MAKSISFNNQKGSLAKNGFEKDFYNFRKNAFFGTTMENVRNRVRLEVIKKDVNEEIIKQ